MKAQYDMQLKYRALDANGDMLFGRGDSDFLSGLQAMGQVLKTRLAAIDGEWWEGDPHALPYYTDILGTAATKKNQDAIDLMVINRIMDTVGVIGVSDVKSTIQNRSYHFECNVQTIYGITTAEVNA